MQIYDISSFRKSYFALLLGTCLLSLVVSIIIGCVGSNEERFDDDDAEADDQEGMGPTERMISGRGDDKKQEIERIETNM